MQVVILDTAGRLHVDEEMMGQLTEIDRRSKPRTGVPGGRRDDGPGRGPQREGFNEALELDGVIMTKLDGDARGGAAFPSRP